MQSPIDSHDAIAKYSDALTVYLTEAGKGSRHRERIAIHAWHMLTPAEKRSQQQAARAIAGNDLSLGAAYTQNVLLFEYASRKLSSHRYRQ